MQLMFETKTLKRTVKPKAAGKPFYCEWRKDGENVKIVVLMAEI